MVNYSDLASLQAFVREYRADMMAKALLGFDTANFVTHIPGNKGQVILNYAKKNGSLIRGFTTTFTGYDSQKLSPITVTVNDFKSELNIIPSDLRYTYLGFLQQNKFDPKDWPIERFIIEQHVAGMAEELEIAIWEGVRTGSGADPIINMVHGFGKRFTDAITDGNTVVPTGTINGDNIIDALDAMYDKLDKRLKNKKVYCYISVNHRAQYFKARGKENLQYITDQWTSAKFNTGNMEIVWVGGLADNKIVITSMDNMLYTYDDNDSTKQWWFKEEHYSIEGSCTLAAGTQIVTGEDGWLILNDQWV